MKKHVFLFFALLPVYGCHEKKQPAENMPAQDSVCSHTVTPPAVAADTAGYASDNDLPPFKYDCPCLFNELGTYRQRNGTLNVYISGTGWDPRIKACWFSWGENVYNMYAGDTSFAVLKVHLLDLERFELPHNDTEYGNENTRQKVIMVYIRQRDSLRDTVIVDPCHTGKYHG